MNLHDRFSGISLSVLFLLLANSSLLSDNWPNRRGPNHDGISAEKCLRFGWKSKPKVLSNATTSSRTSGRNSSTPKKTFFQGLIQAAVCLFHLEGGNLSEARRMYDSCVAYLRPFEPEFAGIDVRQLLSELESCFAELRTAWGDYSHGLRLPADRIPVIRQTNSTPRPE